MRNLQPDLAVVLRGEHEPSRQDAGAADGMTAMAADGGVMRDVLRHLETQTAYYQQLFENSPDAIVLLDRTGAILDANETFRKTFGYDLEALRGQPPLFVIDADDASAGAIAAFSPRTGDTELPRTAEARKSHDGQRVRVEVFIRPVRDAEDHVFAVYRDVTDRERIFDALDFQLRHDPLTGLVNRAEFDRRVQELLAATAAGAGSCHAVLQIRIGNLKLINDAFGHGVGDLALIEVAGLLQSIVRGDDLLARFGGAEFGALLRECSAEKALAGAERLAAKLGEFRFSWRGHDFSLTANIGIAGLREPLSAAEDVASAADAACQVAMTRGPGRVLLYTDNDRDIIARRNDIDFVARLGDDLENDRFVLFRQDIRALSDAAGGLRLQEILVRHLDPAGRLVLPGVFVPAAERYNVMPAIDRWVLRTVCERLARRPEALAECDVFSINLSGRTLEDEAFAAFARQTLAATGMAPSRLCFEITETAAISNLPAARSLIEDLKELGCAIALDDFGKGMSSFAYLKTLPVDYLKIDGSFIREMRGNSVDYAMTEAINNIGRILGLRTVAEFVENDGILECLETIGVDFAQGYAIHVPERWIG